MSVITGSSEETASNVNENDKIALRAALYNQPGKIDQLIWWIILEFVSMRDCRN